MKFVRSVLVFKRGFLPVGLDEYDTVEIAFFVVTPAIAEISEAHLYCSHEPSKLK